MIESVKRRFQSCETCPETGWYEFDGYVSGPFDLLPPLDEMEVFVSAGTAFPAVRSPDARPCFWLLAAGAPAAPDANVLAQF